MPIILDGTTGITTPGITNTGTFVFQGPVQVPAGSAATASITTAAGANTGIYFPSSSSVAITTAGTQRFVVDSAGNAGLGVTPSAWSGVTAFQVKSGSFANNATLDRVYVLSNAYYDGTNWKYINSNPALRYDIESSSGTHAWYIAASGVAGNNISFTQAMTLTSAGNLGIGITNPSKPLVIQLPSGGDKQIQLVQNGSSSHGGIQWVNSAADTQVAVLDVDASKNMVFTVNGSERARISSGGDFGINTSSPGNKLQVVAASATSSADVINIDGGSTGFSGANDAGTSYSLIFNACAYSLASGVVQRTGAAISMAKEYSWNQADAAQGTKGALVFKTNSGDIATPALTERARITSSGQFCIGISTTSGDARLRVVNQDNVSGDFCIVGQVGSNALNTSSYQYIGGNYAGSDNVYIYGNGNIVNTNNSYGTLSDVKLKQDIIDAASQWDDVKAFKFRKFRFKEEVSRNPNAPHQLGLIAQELEQTSPGLVDTTPDRQKEGETMKTIKTSVLLMKATKALQEAMARIEVLEADMAVLKGSN